MLNDEPEPAPIEERVPIRGILAVGGAILVLVIGVIGYRWLFVSPVRPAQQIAAPASTPTAAPAPTAPPDAAPAGPSETPPSASVAPPEAPAPAPVAPAQAPQPPAPVPAAIHPPAPPAPKEKIHGGFAVQVGAFESEDRARQLVHTMALHHQDGHVVEIQGSTHKLYAVRTAVYRTRKEANDEAKLLADNENLPTFVVKLRHGE